MNEPQIVFDQRLQALRITMARPGFETFSIRGFWTCAAGSLHVLASIEALQPHSHQLIIQRLARFVARQFGKLAFVVGRVERQHMRPAQTVIRVQDGLSPPRLGRHPSPLWGEVGRRPDEVQRTDFLLRRDEVSILAFQLF